MAHANANTETTESSMQVTLASVGGVVDLLAFAWSEAYREATRDCRNCYVLEWLKLAWVAERHESVMRCLILQNLVSE
ncbi:hypothetical protein AUEXF2481DRAFT_45193 [Aureobasidium subglaciale EXF-2481]|uniref:Uncharacterized protein n=1 Tax=Aureobasidium subglaciale (strain EXF-2481) TaxID=1043005 RepID=A0A074Y7U3_AURSE|nr:uncharacterized protein AUEXF2481DRAFT_45193 [Aureobasidium subglaciale EXF-2481]KEQ90287.1 hypothetical protein AUEXF2481DRAFT_45193 [Aureobasidium subglaciale EXF-2481]